MGEEPSLQHIRRQPLQSGILHHAVGWGGVPGLSHHLSYLDDFRGFVQPRYLSLRDSLLAGSTFASSGRARPLLSPLPRSQQPIPAAAAKAGVNVTFLKAMAPLRERHVQGKK